MPHRSRVRPGPSLAWITLLLTVLLIVLIPGGQAGAAVTIFTEMLDNSQGDFARGTVQRTSISADVQSPPGTDKEGAVLLTPIGLLNKWSRDSQTLPTPGVQGHGVAALGNRIYTLAGSQGSLQASTTINSVFWATIDQANGFVVAHGYTDETLPAGATSANDFFLDDPLPPAVVLTADECGGRVQTLAPRSDATAAALEVPAGSNTGYLYAIGGFIRATQCSQSNLTTPLVQIGTVTADGNVTWTANDAGVGFMLPSPPIVDEGPPALGDRQLGVADAAAVIVRTSSDNAFLYVTGGLMVATNLPDLTTAAVFYAKIDPTTGRLRHPETNATDNPWVRTGNMPVVPPSGFAGTPGLFDHSAMTSRITVVEDGVTVTRDAIFIAGGYVNPARTFRNEYVYRALVDPDTGALTWSQRPNLANRLVNTEGVARTGLSGFAYNNRLYVVGGTTTSATTSALDSITSAIHDDLFDLQTITEESTEYFIGNNNPANPLLDPLANAGIVLVPARYPEDVQAPAGAGTAWAISLGGRDRSGNTSGVLWRGSIGGLAEANATRRSVEGSYYSRFFDIRIDSDESTAADGAARVLALNWTTEIDRSRNPTADLIIEFRRVRRADARCDEGAFPANTPWVQLDSDRSSSFFSQSGNNRVELKEVFGEEKFNATCFQYRALLTQNGRNAEGGLIPPIDITETPKLLNISVEKTIPGEPDLWIERFDVTVTERGRFDGFDLAMKNLHPDGRSETALVGADLFPVVLCVAYSELEQPEPELEVPTLPIENDDDNRVDCAPVYRWVNRLQTTPDVTLALNTGWYSNYNAHPLLPELGQDQPLADLRTLFATPGHYAVAALIDPFNLVAEGGLGKTNNRGENLTEGDTTPLIRRFTILSTNRLYLPTVVR
ncbi:hypothetical protein EYB53_013980 [Candidatus Chloroploca sp. M-50]|uniref:Uncharacterized protein n=1 Tax=Candidatus Chloroploca mongolica TaxID=2528176 RepID=A0ABS4DBJ2_9CHLR|nr:hypothetical protein [Candidatus Chloroploca mongolica]MBP1466818.1 hypothetical protein [Candidatus Chloroploca mongolica]